MPPTNDFVPFCPTDTGTNLEEQAAYLTDPNRTIGNQPGVASSMLNNKALRQGTAVANAIAQYVSNFLNANVLDNGNAAQLQSQFFASFSPLSPVFTSLLSGAGTWNPTYMFFVSSANATAGATYTNNSQTFTVVNTITAGVILQTTGTGLPAAGSGTLTLATGTGDATISYFSVRSASYLEVEMVGGGGGGGGGVSGGVGANGANTTFGSSLLVAGFGYGGGSFSSGSTGGVGGTPSLGVGPVGIALYGATGCGSPVASAAAAIGLGGGQGASTPFGGGGGGGTLSVPGYAAPANTGAGGGGGGGDASDESGGAGGGAGAYIKALIFSPAATYVYQIGTGGAGGPAGGGGNAGGSGGSGAIFITEKFQ